MLVQSLALVAALGFLEANVEQSPFADRQLRSHEIHIISKTNAEREARGLPPLEVDFQLMETARKHAAWMTNNHAMVHGRYPVAENIAAGQKSPSAVLNAWMNSSGHRANILGSNYTKIGVAAYTTSNGTTYWCQQFTR